MAVLDIADCTITVETPLAGANLWKIVTLTGADDGDTLDVSTVTEQVYSCSVQGATDGLLTALVSAAGVVTLPGVADNEARTIYLFGE